MAKVAKKEAAKVDHGWAVYSPQGWLLAYTIELCRRDSLLAFLTDRPAPWADYKSLGYTVRRVTITPAK